MVKTPPKPKAAAIYARLSKADRDPVTGEPVTLKVEDQIARCREWAEREGWQLASFVPDAGEIGPKRRNGKRPVPEPPKPDTAGVYVDNDVSATKQRPRPQYEVMLRDAEAGRIDGIISVDSDRLTRRPIELETIIALHEKHGVALATLGGLVDLGSPSGRLTARLLASVASHETEAKAVRQRRANEAAAARGEQYGGMSGDARPFGWLDGGQVLHEAEAQQVSHAVDELLKGANFRPIVDRWNTTGLPTARGGQWTLTSVRQVLIRWRNAGIAHRHGTPVAEGDWEPIFQTSDGQPDTAKLVAIREYFEGRKSGRTTARTYLLSNIAVCGVCGSPLRHGAANVKDRTPQDTYRCNNFGGGAKCGLNISRAILEEVVIDYIVGELALPDSGILAQTGSEVQAVKALRERKAELEAEADEIRSNKSLRPSWRADLLADLDDQIRPLEADLARRRGREGLSSLLLDLTPWAKVSKSGKITVSFDQSKREKQIRARFSALGGDDIGPKRAVVKAVCQSVVVMPHPKGVKPTTQSARERIVITGFGGDEQEQ